MSDALKIVTYAITIPTAVILVYLAGKVDVLDLLLKGLISSADDMIFESTRAKIADEVELKMTYMCGCRNCIERVRAIIMEDSIPLDNQCDVCTIQDCQVKNRVRVAYVCDRRYCSEGCNNTDCHHTEDIHHAKNFECVGDGKWMEKEE